MFIFSSNEIFGCCFGCKNSASPRGSGHQCYNHHNYAEKMMFSFTINNYYVSTIVFNSFEHFST